MLPVLGAARLRSRRTGWRGLSSALLPAMAATLVVTASAARGATGYATWSRPGLVQQPAPRVSAMTMRDGPAPSGTSRNQRQVAASGYRERQLPAVSDWRRAGHQLVRRPGRPTLSPAAELRLFNSIPGSVFQSLAEARAWVGARHITAWISCHEAGRYWIFQGILAAILLVLAVTAAFTAVWLARPAEVIGRSPTSLFLAGSRDQRGTSWPSAV